MGSNPFVRTQLLAEIDKKLNEQSGIQSLALIGIGGSGKTTLARTYAAQHQKNSIVWEINAETSERLKESFENLALTLAQTEQDKNTYRELKGIKNIKEREEKFLQFVKEKLRASPNWFLIFDNVERFIDVQKYYPHDPNLWGYGKVILTTRDSNVQNNHYIRKAIQIKELTPKESLQLFVEIMSNGEPSQFSAQQIEEAKQFLEKIPPFPLDTSVAAYYLKTTNTPYAQYLENLKAYNTEFATVQENVLKEASENSKTRHSIITLSLERLLSTHADFADLLFFISLLDSQYTPRDLLDQYKENAIVDNFIYNLKKYSLITDNLSLPSLGPTISVDRSTQAISLSYLTKMLKPEVSGLALQAIADVLADYVADTIRKDNYEKIRYLPPHFESLLNHSNFFTEDLKGALETDMGHVYLALGYNEKAIKVFEDALIKLNHSQHKNYKKVAQNLTCQGICHTLGGNFEKSQPLLEEGLRIYKQHAPDNYLAIAFSLLYLGEVYKWTGNYEKAKDLLEECLDLYKKTPRFDPMRQALALANLGNVYGELGNYKKALATLLENVDFCKKNLPENSLRLGWGLAFLGTIYSEVGHYERAKDLIEKSLEILKINLPKNHFLISMNTIMLGMVHSDHGRLKTAKELLEAQLLNTREKNDKKHVVFGWGLASLGNVYKEEQDFEKAKTLLNDSLTRLTEAYGKDHIKAAYPLRVLGQVYLHQGALEKAEQLLQQSLEISLKYDHPHRYQTLESLSELYLKKAESFANKNNQQHQALQLQALNFLKQAYEIVQSRFPNDSPHIKRLQSKLDAMQKI
jgi:tetratricopeptide (TPR) repeat protein